MLEYRHGFPGTARTEGESERLQGRISIFGIP